MNNLPTNTHGAGDDDDNDFGATPLNEELTEEDLTLSGDSATNNDDDDQTTGNDDGTIVTATSQQVLVTKEGLKKLKEELENLENVRRREIAQRLKEAIAYGDLSENSEYEDAKNEQAFVEGRINELTAMIKDAKIIAETTTKGKTVKIGSTVTIQNLTDKDEPETYTIVGSTEADPRDAKISNESPIGSAVIDQEQGDTVEIKAPAGKFKYKILKVS